MLEKDWVENAHRFTVERIWGIVHITFRLEGLAKGGLTKSDAAPSPTKNSVAPSPTKNLVAPSPTKNSMAPSPTKNLAHNKHTLL